MEISLLNSIDELAAWPDEPGRVLISDDCWGRIRVFASLTQRETQVCRHVFEGATREEVADSLQLSPRTIRHYMELIHVKLRVSDRVGLVLRLIQIRDYLLCDG